MKVLIISLFFLSSPNLFALTAKEVVDSSLKHHPEVQKAILDLKIVSSQKKTSLGAFDSKIIGEAQTRSSGFYDGDYAEAKIVKPLKFLNSKVYAGYRNSNDLFPSYEGKFETLSQGEKMFGISVSLLRDSIIDQRRVELLNADQRLIQSKLLVLKRKTFIQTLALQAYWDWFTLGHQVKVREELLNLAKKRNQKLLRRIKAGDLARIYQTENEQYIVSREMSYLKSLNKFQKASLLLSLFYRDDQANPRIISKSLLPKIDEMKLENYQLPLDSQKVIESRNLKLKILESKELEAKNLMRLGKNLYLPKLDFSYEYSQDAGRGSKSLLGGENRFMLKFEIPLEFNKARGKKNAGKAKVMRAQTEIKFVQDKIHLDLNKIKFDLKNSFEIYKLTKDKILLSQKLVYAEEQKFRSGASDLILVNLREQSYAKSKIENLQALLHYKLVVADLKRLLVEFL